MLSTVMVASAGVSTADISYKSHMNHSLYEYSLCIALPLMIFFGVYFMLPARLTRQYSPTTCVRDE